MNFNFNFGRPHIMVQCPKCGGNNISERENSILCNECHYRVDDKMKDLNILLKGGGEMKPL